MQEKTLFLTKMHSEKFSVILLSFLGFIITISEAQQPTYLSRFCYNRTFPTNSKYHTKLNVLFLSLSSVRSTTGFYSTTVSQASSIVYIYAQALCRGDFSTNVCQSCVDFAEQNLRQRCPNLREAIIWFDECFLRYSDKPIISTYSSDPAVFLIGVNITTEPARFNQLVSATMNDIATKAANSVKKFAVKETNFVGSQNLFSLVQCTPDLSISDCNRCLRVAFSFLPNCCSAKQGGRVLLPSCNFRYELYPFYNASAVTAEAPPASPSVLPSPPPSSTTRPKESGGISRVTIIAIVIPITVSIVLFCLGLCFLCRRAKRQSNFIQENDEGNEITIVQSLQFDLASIEAATKNFSVDNRLGEGGFGQVYKGILPNGQEIAVKRLSRSSGQGAEEFKNEVVVVAKLQHRNLVRLLGFCLEGEEKLLVYEFVPNGSLDYFLFDPEKQRQLNWSTRYKIIGGVARGILYLHTDSRLKIIHRDLKTSNILIDRDMNPKISDFGMARIFEVDQTQGNTKRIVGTYGYMSPEYAMHGEFSIKSDVYSFGVMVLEIISGKKISSFHQTDGAYDLKSYVWKHWREGTPLQVLDPTLAENYSRNEVVTCIHIGLLCVQEDPADRPSMATVAHKLNDYTLALPSPQQPAFFLDDRKTEARKPTTGRSQSVALSVAEASITEFYPR